jgi:hypothetical protein
VNLASRGSQTGLPNYYTMVRPQIEQQQENIAQQRRTAQLQDQVNRAQQQAMQSQNQMSGYMITGRVGWSSRGFPRFGSYLNFYPGFQRMPR